MKVLEILEKARAYLGQGPEKWIQGKMSDNYLGPEPNVCAIGACLLVTNDDATDEAGWGPGWQAEEALDEACDQLFERDNIIAFNDAEGTTYDEIMAIFDLAISNERKRRGMAEKSSCCGAEMAGVEYAHNDPNHFDGISEWVCLDCKTRYGRWTNNILQPGESEPRYGGEQGRSTK